MDPYLVQFLARYGGGLLLAAGWIGVAWRGRGVDRVRAMAWLSAAAATCWGLGVYLEPLIRGAPIPDDPGGLWIAVAAPFAAASVLLVWLPEPAGRGAEPAGFDLWGLSPVVLIPYGLVAWVPGVLWLARGWLAPDRPRRGLLLGIALLGLHAGIDAHRLEARSLADAITDLSGDDASLGVSCTSSLAWVAGWTMLTAQIDASRDRRRAAVSVGAPWIRATRKRIDRARRT